MLKQSLSISSFSTQAMSRFLIRILLFSAGILLIFIIGLALPDNAHRQNLHYALIDKVNLLENVPSPRIILVGGSNLSFGIDSRKVRDELNINL